MAHPQYILVADRRLNLPFYGNVDVGVPNVLKCNFQNRSDTARHNGCSYKLKVGNSVLQ